jgi:hypothetical protein
VNEPDDLEGHYRVKSDGPEAPWKDGEPVFQPGAMGNFLVFGLIFGAGPFIYMAIYHWLMPST